MKILIVYHSAALEPSKAIFAALAKDPNVELRVLGPKKGWNKLRGIWQEIPETSRQNGYSLVPGNVFRSRKDFSGPYLTGLLKEMLEFKPDVIHVFNDAYSAIHLQVLLYKILFRLSAKICCHGVENIIQKKSQILMGNMLRKIVINLSDAVSCWSESAADALRQTGFPSQKLKIHYWGVPLKLFAGRRNKALRKSLSIDECFVVGYVGRLVKEKGLLTVLESLKLLPPTVVFLCVGDGPFLKNFLDEAEKQGVKKRVILIPRVEEDEVSKLMQAMDCLVLPSLTTPSWKEQFGRVLPEAMSCGLPVIGSNSGAIPEIIGDAGLLFPESDGIALAKCMKKIMHNEEFRQQVSFLGQKRAKDHFSVEAYAKNLSHFYREIIG